MIRFFILSVFCFVSHVSWAWEKVSIDAYFRSKIDSFIGHASPSVIHGHFGRYLHPGSEVVWETIAAFSPEHNYVPYIHQEYFPGVGNRGLVSIGWNKQCVNFVRTVGNNIPPANTWQSFGNIIAHPPNRFDVIATFGNDGKYSGHVAIFLETTAMGLYVIDQNYDANYGAIAVHIIPWNSSKYLSKASNYSVVYKQ